MSAASNTPLLMNGIIEVMTPSVSRPDGFNVPIRTGAKLFKIDHIEREWRRNRWVNVTVRISRISPVIQSVQYKIDQIVKM
jgi:hypothetical protein